jgi:hypothetical protein
MAVPPKKKSEIRSRPHQGIRTQRTCFFDAPETPSGSTGPNNKTIDDGCKVFFLENQFSLAFGEKKSILRNKKRALELLVSRLGEINNSVGEKSARASLLLLTKSSIFDK